MTEELEVYQAFSLVRASAKVLVSVTKSLSSNGENNRQESDKNWRCSFKEEPLFDEPTSEMRTEMGKSQKVSSLELQISVLKQKKAECQLERESLEHIVKKQRASATQWKSQELDYRNKIEDKDSQIGKLEEQAKYTAEMTKFFQKSLQAMQAQAEETQRVKTDLEAEVRRLKETHERVVTQREKMEDIVISSKETLKRARETEAKQTIELCQLRDDFSRLQERTKRLEGEIEKERDLRKEREAVIEVALKEKEELVSQINNWEEMLLKTQALVASQRELIYRSSREGEKGEQKEKGNEGGEEDEEGMVASKDPPNETEGGEGSGEGEGKGEKEEEAKEEEGKGKETKEGEDEEMDG